MILPFPADSAEFEEYVSVMESMADEADKLPDPEPADLGVEDDSYLQEPAEYEDFYPADDEDRYLDSYWEDQAEYGMEGCCGDF